MRSSNVVDRLKEHAAAEREAYANDAPRPLGSYGLLMGVYATAVTGSVLLVRQTRRPVPERLGWADLLLGGVATYRMSRLITKDSVTAFGRAPFARFEEAAGSGEVNEEPRGSGLGHALGELLTCPFCIAQWVATGYVVGLLLAPRFTRIAAGVLGVVSLSDGLQFAHAELERTEHQS
ncbi:MAG: DUF1360 domain-containing protein [Acidimicrobiales bacterium]